MNKSNLLMYSLIFGVIPVLLYSSTPEADASYLIISNDIPNEAVMVDITDRDGMIDRTNMISPHSTLYEFIPLTLGDILKVTFNIDNDMRSFEFTPIHCRHLIVNENVVGEIEIQDEVCQSSLVL